MLRSYNQSRALALETDEIGQLLENSPYASSSDGDQKDVRWWIITKILQNFLPVVRLHRSNKPNATYPYFSKSNFYKV